MIQSQQRLPFLAAVIVSKGSIMNNTYVDSKQLSLVQGVLDLMVEKQDSAGASCLIIKEGQEVGYFEAGWSNISSNIRIKRNSIFRIYSMSKIMTSVAAMILVQDGKLDLASPVSEYINSFDKPEIIKNKTVIPAKRPVIIQDLLNMTSGYGYGETDSESGKQTLALINKIVANIGTKNEYTTKEVAEEIGKLPLEFEPGSQFMYGLSADIMGAVIETVSGMKFSDFLGKRIWGPLNMKDTGFFVPEESQNRLSKVYETKDNQLFEYHGSHLGIRNSMNDEPAFESGGAGVASTIDDIASFAKMLLGNGELNGNRILTPKAIEFMSTSTLSRAKLDRLYDWESLPGFGYANLVRVLVNPEEAVTLCSKGEYGWDGWLGTYLSIDPMNKMAIILMQQLKDSGTTTYTRRIRNIVYASLR